MKFNLNGKKKEYKGDPELPLLTYLREIEGIISPKDGCAPQASCGCCTVELNGKAVAAISVSPLHTGGDKALASLLLTLSALGTTKSPNTAVAIGSIKSKMNETGQITNPGTLGDLNAILASLLDSINP